MTDQTAVAPSDDVADGEDDEKRTPFYRGVGGLVVVAVLLAIFMKTFLVQAFFIPSGSMEKTLHGCPGCPGDRVLVNKVVYKFRDIHRGEIVVFNGKHTNFGSEGSVSPPKNMVERVLRNVQGLVGFGAPGEKDFIKRVIGVEGDVVACCDLTKKDEAGNPIGRVTINGEPIDEPYVYLTDPSEPHASFDPVTVGKDHLFVMGDHRDGSSDSRVHGTIPENAVIGRAFAVFFPPGRQKVLRVPAVFDPTKRDGAPAETPTALPAAVAGGVPAELLSPPVLGLAVVIPVTLVRRRRRRPRD